MKVIKIYQENGLKPSFAHQTDSGIDTYANSVDLILNTSEGQLVYQLLKKDQFNLPKEEKITIITELLINTFEYLIDSNVIVINGFLKYFTGTRTILKGIDLKGHPKSSKFLKASYLGNLQNGIGVVDENYRGEILFIYEINPNVVWMLMKSTENPFVINTFANNIYIPSPDVAIGQLVPPKVEEGYEIEYLPEWLPEFNNTDRGEGGHGSTNR